MCASPAIDEKLVPRRYAVLTVVAIGFWALQLYDRHAGGGDWASFVNGARRIEDLTNIGVYVGPVALLLALPFTHVSYSASWVIVSALCMALGLVAVRNVEQAAAILVPADRRRRERAVLFGGLFLLHAWSLPGAADGHADDVIVLTCAAVAVRAVAQGRWLLVSVMLAVAIDTKPWAGLLVPLAAATAGTRIRGLLWTAILAGVPLLPFVILHGGNLDVGYLNLPVAPESLLHYLGVPVGSRPGWPRVLQLAIALPLGALAVYRGRWYLVPVIALAVRINLDPATAEYYMTGAIFGLFIWDLVRPMRWPGARTTYGCAGMLLLPANLLIAYAYGSPAVALVNCLRLSILVAAVIALFTPSTQQRAPSTNRPGQALKV